VAVLSFNIIKFKVKISSIITELSYIVVNSLDLFLEASNMTLLSETIYPGVTFF